MAIRPVVLAASIAIALSAGRAEAQRTEQRVIAVGDGDTIQLIHRSLFDRGPAPQRPSRRVDFLYQTRIAASDSAARHKQADRVAQVLGPEAVELGVRVLSLGICDTEGCTLGRQPPSHWFLYEHGNDGWRRLILR